MFALIRTATVAAVLALPALSQQDDSMGPVGFVWPAAREWSSTADNSSPCGSSEGVSSSRTQFPLTNGAVSILVQEESYRINLAISYSSNPRTNADFVTLVSYSNFPYLESGRECYGVPDPSSDATTGTNATLQLSYVSDAETGVNQTFYACADIEYVKLSDFTDTVSCYNSTDSTKETSSAGGIAPTPAKTSSSSSSSTGASYNDGNGASHHRKLSGGAIAGIVVGVCVAVALIVAIAVFLTSRRHEIRRKRIVSELRHAELKRISKESKATSNIANPSASA